VRSSGKPLILPELALLVPAYECAIAARKQNSQRYAKLHVDEKKQRAKLDKLEELDALEVLN
jgi:hypothetical protein